MSRKQEQIFKNSHLCQNTQNLHLYNNSETNEDENEIIFNYACNPNSLTDQDRDLEAKLEVPGSIGQTGMGISGEKTRGSI